MFARFVSATGKMLLYILLVFLAVASLWYFCFVSNGRQFSEALTNRLVEHPETSVTLSWTGDKLPVSYTRSGDVGASPVTTLPSAPAVDVSDNLAKIADVRSALEISIDVARGTLQGVLASRPEDASATMSAWRSASDKSKEIKSVVIVDDDESENADEETAETASHLDLPAKATALSATSTPELFSDDIPLYTARYELAGKICGLPITFDSAYHKYSLTDYEETLSDLPAPMLSALAEKGWSIHITGKPIEDRFPFVEWTRDVDAVAGVCMVLDKEIWFLDDCSPMGLVHEIGHAIDWESGGASLSHEWADAISPTRELRDKNAFDHLSFDEVTFGNVDSFSVCESVLGRERFFEQYATAFAYYWGSPMSLLEECPELYAYFANRFGVWAGRDTDIEECQGIMETVYERGVNRRSNPIGAPDIDDVGVEENELRALTDALGDYADGYEDKTTTGKLFAWIRAAEDMAQRYAQSYGA